MGEICSDHDESFPWQVVMPAATIRKETARSGAGLSQVAGVVVFCTDGEDSSVNDG
jgi:hypothetical protein